MKFFRDKIMKLVLLFTILVLTACHQKTEPCADMPHSTVKERQDKALCEIGLYEKEQGNEKIN